MRVTQVNDQHMRHKLLFASVLLDCCFTLSLTHGVAFKGRRFYSKVERLLRVTFTT